MAGTIIWCVTVFGCAVLFVGLGIYAKGLKKPMWFWAGTEVDPNSITDVKAYNAENAKMWMWYSLWYWVAGFAWFWSEGIALAAMILGSSVGIGMLIHTFQKIEKKYKA